MFNIEKINLTFSFNPFLFILFLMLLGGYAFFVYRYTVPLISPARKFILTALRTISLILILFIVFEPILTLAKKLVLQPVNFVFVDNSRSILINDGTNRRGVITDFLRRLSNENLLEKSALYSFGIEPKPLENDDPQELAFDEGVTNFEKVFNSIQKDRKNIASISVITDGVITEGINPLYSAEKLGVPVFTIGLGDTTQRNDVEVKSVLFNEYIYAETPTTIASSITNRGFVSASVSVSLFEDNTLIEQKNISLSDAGIQNVNFAYTPKTGGEKKLTVVVSNLEGEFSTANNKKIFYINVLSNKLKILLLAGSPSSDLSFIRNTLKSDENLEIKSVTYLGNNKFLEQNDKQKLIDSADVIFMIGFPSAGLPADLTQAVQKAITEKNKPFFSTLTSGIHFPSLRIFQQELPFTIGNFNNQIIEVQPSVSSAESRNPLIQNNAIDPINAWNNLPPIYQPAADLKPKPESYITARVKVNNVPLNSPLILTRRLGGKRSIALLASDLWKWKLQTAQRNLDLFDRFILSSVKWLNTSEDKKQVTIKSSKRVYSPGEQIEFSAQVYDEAFNPVTDAEVKISLSDGSQTGEVFLNSLGSGLYEGIYLTNKPGDYSYSGEALLAGKSIGTDAGKFNIGEVDVEMLTPPMNIEFLNLLAIQTGGKFFHYSDYAEYFSDIKQLLEQSSKEKIAVSEISLWSNEWLMAIVILLLSFEWFLRKRAGML
jgi:hypothetical protein